MRYLGFISLFALGVFPASFSAAASSENRSIPCKTPAIAQSCRWVHGRLATGNGTPAYRLWAIGTHHLFGILSGPGPLPELDNEDPQVPENLERLMPHAPSYIDVFGDFEVCPLEPERTHTMQMACIQSAKKLITK
jgi:hypothetical protein